MKKRYLIVCVLLVLNLFQVQAQDYFLNGKKTFNPEIPSPEAFLGYPIGTHHTRVDRIVAYMEKLAQLSDRATIEIIGKTYEHRQLMVLTVSSVANMGKLQQIKAQHKRIVENKVETNDLQNTPVFIALGYGVHGNEASAAEAAMLAAYVLVASENEEIKKYLDNSVCFIDPVLNPDGRDRFNTWVNMYKSFPPVADPLDAEHTEAWPGGRTNHYWFDLNRDWFLAVHPESRSRLKWYHNLYPNVYADFHEMGTNSTYFFEPKKRSAAKNPITPKENYTTLNTLFAKYFSEALDGIGTLYFTNELFDGTYPGYGSSYPDLQGGLGLLFEQGSSRGLVQESNLGNKTFAFAVRNQFVSTFATIKAASENKQQMNDYLNRFFRTAISNGQKAKVKAYVFGDKFDENRTRAFVDKLLLHNINVYELEKNASYNGKNFKVGKAYVVPTKQPQYRMVRNVFETYNEYRDSVYYDASAWSLVNFYNMPHAALSSVPSLGSTVYFDTYKPAPRSVEKSNYAYLVPWEDYNAPALLYFLKENKIRVSSAFKPFSVMVKGAEMKFGYGTLLVPVSKQDITANKLHSLLQEASAKFNVAVYASHTGLRVSGNDLGSNNFRAVSKPKVLLLVGNGVSSYEAGEVWHLANTKLNMPITKVPMRNFGRIKWANYNTMVMVSGRYYDLDSVDIQQLKNWLTLGNTLVTIRGATEWAVRKKLVKENLVKLEKDKEKKDKVVERRPYNLASEYIGRENIGGAIFEVELDLTHPVAFGYTEKLLPVYRSSNVWLASSKSPYSTVAKYTKNPHIDGYITDINLNKYLKASASVVVSAVGRGRVVLFTDNPNFRGSWFGTNRMFINSLFLGEHIRVYQQSIY